MRNSSLVLAQYELIYSFIFMRNSSLVSGPVRVDLFVYVSRITLAWLWPSMSRFIRLLFMRNSSLVLAQCELIYSFIFMSYSSLVLAQYELIYSFIFMRNSSLVLAQYELIYSFIFMRNSQGRIQGQKLCQSKIICGDSPPGNVSLA